MLPNLTYILLIGMSVLGIYYYKYILQYMKRTGDDSYIVFLIYPGGVMPLVWIGTIFETVRRLYALL